MTLRNTSTLLQYLQLSLGAIVLSTSISACGTSPQPPLSSASVDPTTSASPSSGMMDHSRMNQGGMKQSMDLGLADATYDLRFIDAMIPHHEGAVMMANDALKKATRPELKRLAKAIVSAQDKEMIQMKQWRKDWYSTSSKVSMEQMREMKMNMDLGNADSDYDLRFINAMILHHEAAVVMGKDLAQKTKRPELQKLAKEIVSSQQAEVDQMNQWRKSWYSK